MSPESSDRTGVGLTNALRSIDDWNARFSTAVVSSGTGILATHGDTHKVVRVASLTKLVTAWTVLIAVEEGAVSLSDPLGPPGATVAHLLCHAGGWDFDTTTVLARPGTKRIYSNTGYGALATHVGSATSIRFTDYMAEAVLAPLGMTASELRGSAARELPLECRRHGALRRRASATATVGPLNSDHGTPRAVPGPGWGASGMG
ncbi:MAG: beta-lactamase family protein [Microthrixaceae bacterium]|nr:beta-lactamase family protein [Microthrixaceae bacterium]